MRLDIDVRPRSRGDNRALRRELRSRSPRECGAYPDRDACGGVPRNLGKLGRLIAISPRSAPNQLRFPCLQRTHSRSFRFDRDPLPVRQRRGRQRSHCRAQRLIPGQPAQPSLAMGRVPNRRPPHWYRGRLSLFPAHFTQPTVDGLPARSNSGSADATILFE